MPGIFDVSIILSEKTPVYPGDPEFKQEKVTDLTKQGYETSKISMGTHTGTHIDAPAHFFKGKTNIEELDLNGLVGKALLIEFMNDDFVSAADLKAIDFKDHTRILFKTRNSSPLTLSQFSEDYIYLDESAAEYLVEKGIRLIGYDYYTMDKYNSDMPVHKKLLENEIIVIEGLDFTDVDPGEYELIALPLRIMAEASPARVILRQFVAGNIP